MANLGYKKYISSKKWAKKRTEVFDASKSKRCEICRTDKNLHVHHLTYQNFKNENIDELAILCKTCHLTLVHASQFEEKQVFNYWITLLKSSTNVNGKRMLPEGMIFEVPPKRGERYLRHRFMGKRFWLVRGNKYKINDFGFPVKVEGLKPPTNPNFYKFLYRH